MTDPIIQVEKLGKRYTLGAGPGGREAVERAARYRTIRESLTETARGALRLGRNGHGAHGRHAEDFWALKDVSFAIRPGEVVGIIGRNGAGKSTLLKVLSRITEPTEGRVRLRGRVASLLEVGTGFHPELTGRENIYLNGSILGMARAEIRAKFDEIVAFAEVERFLDTPVKRYSSGMYVRLAFAVAAHLEPEILIVDEVLAVGDAEFQKKCLGKMDQVAKSEGRTVLFVSHQMNAVQNLCASCLLLRGGRLEKQGPTAEIISAYLQAGSAQTTWLEPTTGPNPFANPYFRPTRLELRDDSGAPLAREARADEELEVVVEGHAERTDPALTVGFAIYSLAGQLMFWSLQTDTAPARWPKIVPGPNRLRARLPAHLLNEGDYRLELLASLHFRTWLCQPDVHAPTIGFGVRGGLSESPFWITARPGLLAPVLPFEAF